MEEQTELNSIAQAGYEAYGAHRNWRAFDGNPIPPWGAVRPEIQAGWEQAVIAITDASVSTGWKSS